MASPQILIYDALETITIDGTTDAALRADTSPFKPTTPSARVKEAAATTGADGGESSADYENVIESFGVDFLGAIATVRIAVLKVNRLFERARKYKVPGVLPVYMKFRPDSSEAWYRSQILNGRAVWADATLDWMWPSSATLLTLILQRRFYWEADTEAEIPLSIATGAASYATGGVTLRNHEDAAAGHTNGAEIDASVITGDLPAPPRLEFKNTTGGTYAGIWVSHEIIGVGAVTPTLEGESSSGGDAPGYIADALSTNAFFVRKTWASAAETDLLTWSTQLTAAQLANMGGRFFRVMARFATAPTYTDLWLRLRLAYPAGYILQTSKLLMQSTSLQLQELGAIQLPPHLLTSTNLVTLYLTLQAVRTGNAVGPINIVSSTAVNPSVVTATAHGFVTGQAVNISGHTVNTAINGLWLVTRIDANSFSVPVLGIGGGGGATGTVAPAAVLDLDYLQLWALDGWRKYTAVFSGIAINDTLRDDMMSGDLGTLLAGGLSQKNYTATGKPILLQPGPAKQRLRVLWMRTTGLSTVDDTITLRAYYRPRRLTI